MRSSFSLAFVALVCCTSTTLLGNQPVNAQISTAAGSNNPFDYFTFKPEDVARFLWGALNPTHQQNLEAQFRNLQTYKNASGFLVQIANQVLGKNTTQMLLGYPVVPKLLEVLDSELPSLLQNVNLKNENLSEIISQLFKFDVNTLSTPVMRQALWDLQSALPNITERVNATIDKLENDVSIESELTEQLQALGVPPQLYNMTVGDLDEALRKLVTQVLMKDPNWGKMSDFEKLQQILMKFDYEGFGNVVVSSPFKFLQSLLTSDQAKQMRDFIVELEDLENARPFDVIAIAAKNIPMLQNYTDKLANFTELALDYEVLLSDVFSSINQGLLDSMRYIMSENDTLYEEWKDTNVVDVQRLVMILSSVDYGQIGERIFKGILDNISQKKYQPEVHIVVTKMYSDMNASRAMIDSTTDSSVSLFYDSITKLRNLPLTASNFSNLQPSGQLMEVVENADYRTFMERLIVAGVRYEGPRRISTPLQQNISDVLQAIINKNTTLLKQLLEDDLTEARMALLLDPALAAALKPTHDAFIDAITNQLIDTYQLVANGNDTRATRLLASDGAGRSFSALTDAEKLIHVALSVDFEIIGQTLMRELEILLETRAGDLLDKLRKGDSIEPDLEMLLDSALKLVYSNLPVNMTRAVQAMFTLSQNVTDVVLDDINMQMTKLYGVFSTNNTLWQASNHTNIMKLRDLLMHYDYSSTGEKLLWEALRVADVSIPDLIKPTIDEFIKRVANKDSVQSVLEEIRSSWERDYSDINWPSKYSMIPVYAMVDSQIGSLPKKTLDEWKAVPGKLQKIFKFGLALNSSKIVDAALAAWGRVNTHQIIEQLSKQMPDNYTQPIEEFMNVVESDGLRLLMQDFFEQVAGNSTIVERLLNSTVIWSVVDSLSASLMDAHKTAADLSGSEWQRISAVEKLTRMIMELDVTTMLTKAANVGEKSLTTAITYLRGVVSPTYSQNCSMDLSSITAALSDPLKKENMWAAQLVDSWGKPSTGILQGAIVWPGDLKECHAVEGNRVVGGVTTDQKIKGAWTMAAIKLPKGLLPKTVGLFAGGGDPQLSLGMCLPKSCDYNDTMKFIGRVKLVGANISYLKPASEYPGNKGTYKTDSAFIGVSAMFTVILAAVVFSTCADGMLMRKECKKQKLETKQKYLPDEKPSKNGTMYNGAEVVIENQAYEAHGDEKPGKDLEASKMNGHTGMNGHVAMKAETPKKKGPGIGIQLIKSFSLYENLPKLMDCAPKPNQLQSLDAIRFFSMTWVILGHTYAFLGFGSYAKNMRVGFEFGADGDWTFNGISGGLFAVDTFFVLSGLLVGYLFLKTLDKLKGRLNCLTLAIYYIHRYLRLLPMYGAIILFTIAYHNYIGYGPFNIFFSDAYKDNCRTNWWTNLLYINNLVRNDKMCAGVSWYLANDMQFYVISPLLLVPLYWFPKFGIAMISAFWAGHIAVTGWLWSLRKNGASQFGGDPAIFADIYIKPYCRIGPYLIGLLLAYFLLEQKNTNIKKRLQIKSGIIQMLWWLMSFGILAVCVYVPYDYTKEKGVGSSSWNKVERAAYETLCRSAWGIAVGWIIFACNTNCGGVIGSLLNWSGWAPLSRLTYGAYLFHPVVMDVYYKNMNQQVYIDHMNLFYMNISFVAVSYMVAAVLHLLLEAPWMGIEKIILSKLR